MKATIRSVAAALLLGALLSPAVLRAQDNSWTGGVGGNWTDSNSWSVFAVPDPSFDARAIIGSDVGSASPIGSASVTADIRASNPAPDIVLGFDTGNQGTLNITGAMAVRAGTGSGHVDVGLDNGSGFLNVNGGTLEIDAEFRTGNNSGTDSSISISGAATVSADSGFLDRNLLIDGSNVNMSFTNDLILGQAGAHTWRIPASGASTILVGTNADLGGTLRVEFPDGAPAVGTTWNLVDSTLVDQFESPGSGFNNLDASAVPLGVGQQFAVNSVAGGTNGMLTQLSLEQHPVLTVDRSTGAVAITNPGSATSVNFDVYTISSDLGVLSPAGWTSIAPNNSWSEASPSANALTELNTTTSESLASGASFNLGNAVSLPAPTFFGEETEDVRFRFAKPDGRDFIEGVVVFTGIANNTLTLNVDPTTGEAQIVNGTPFSATIDIYQVSSASSSLEPGNGDWNSLEDQGADWQEANVSQARIAELLPVGGLTINPNDIIDLGAPFDEVSGAQDLVFEFALVGDALGSAGDFNSDGARDGDDFLQWQQGNSPNPVSAADLADWGAGYGIPVTGADLLTGKVFYGPLVTPSGGAAGAVPEPSTLGLLASCGALLVGVRRRMAA